MSSNGLSTESSTSLSSSAMSSRKAPSKASTSPGARSQARKAGGSSTKPKRATRKASPWGDLHTKSGRWTFNRYLRNLKSAEQLATKGGVRLLRGLSGNVKRKIYKRLREVDPEGTKELVKKIQGTVVGTRRRRRERKAMQEAVLEKHAKDLDDLLLVEGPYHKDESTVATFVSGKGMYHAAAIYMAAGYKPSDVANKLDLPVEDIINNVTKDMVRRVKTRLSAEIVAAADGKVLQDLLEGSADDSTNRADLIATRRRKLVIDARGPRGDGDRLSEGERKMKEDLYHQRFLKGGGGRESS